MSRSGYSDDIDDNWAHIRWRGAVKSALRGKRGQAFLREALAALYALPERKLVTNELEADGQFCLLGAVGRMRGIDMSTVDPEDQYDVAGLFDLPHAMACEIMFKNDECGGWRETPEERWGRMRNWVQRHIITEDAA